MDTVFSGFNERQTMLNNTLEVYHYKDPYFKAPDFHSHDFFEFYFFIDGCVTYHIEENVYNLTPGDVLIIPPGELHRPVIVNAKAAYERIVLWINSETILKTIGGDVEFKEKLISYLHNKNHLLHFEKDDFKENCKLLNNIISCLHSDEQENQILLIPYLSILLITLFKFGKSSLFVVDNAENTISQLILYINENIEKDLHLDTLSELFYMSKYHLLRSFKAYTNTTIGQYITSKRIVRVKLLLKQGYTLLEASQECGFNNYSNFYKAFLKETGMSPKVYKENNK